MTADDPTQNAVSTQIAQQTAATEYDALWDDFAGPNDSSTTEPAWFTQAAAPFAAAELAPLTPSAQPGEPVQTTVPVSQSAPVPTVPASSTTVPTTTETTTAPHIHSYHTTASDATCTDRGFILKSCECGDRQFEYTSDALGHDFGEYTVSKEATPTETGEKVRVCLRCGLQENEVIPKVRPYISKESALEMLQLINQDRAQSGAQPLTFNETYYAAAVVRAHEIGENYSHTRPNGQPWHTVFAEQGPEYIGVYGENIYNPYGDSVSPADGEIAFMNSAGHRKNILNPNYKSASICVLYTENRTYFVQLFFG